MMNPAYTQVIAASDAERLDMFLSTAGRIVQALHWLKDTFPADRDRVVSRLSSVIADPRSGKVLRDDLRAGLATLPAWMQSLVRELVDGGTSRSVTSRQNPGIRQLRKRPTRLTAAAQS